MILQFAFLIAGAQAGPATDPAFQLAKTFIGGVWRGKVGKDVTVEFRYTLEQNGTMIVANGVIGAGSKHPVPARTSLGWDPEAKQVYYLDQHGATTVYFGHVTREGNSLIFDFRVLCGDTGHYRSRAEIELQKYTSTMDYDQNGKWVGMGFHLQLDRVK